MKKHLLLLCLLFKIVDSSAQVVFNPVFQHLEQERMGVREIKWFDWDKNGTFWGSCEDGIFSYDGYSTKKWNYKKGDSTSILSSNIVSTYLDKENNVWIGYGDNNAVSKISIATGKLKHFLPKINSAQTVPLHTIVNFKEDSKGNFWLLTWGGGLVKMNRETGVCKSYLLQKAISKADEELVNRVKDISELPDGRLFIVYFANEDKPYLPKYFDPITEIAEDFPIENYVSNSTSEIAKRIIQSIKIAHFIYVDKNNNFWIGTYSGLIFIDLKNKKSYRIAAEKNLTKQNLDNTKTYMIDENSLLWVGTLNAGLMVVNMETKAVNYITHDIAIAGSISDNRVGSIKKDIDKNIWVRTKDGVLNIYNPLVQQFKVAEWKNMNLEFSNRSEQKAPANQLLVDKKGNLNLSSENGLYIYNIDSGSMIKNIDPRMTLNKNYETENYKSRIQDIRLISKNKLLIISPYFPAIYDLRLNTFQRIKLEEDAILQGEFKLLFKHTSPGKAPLIVSGLGGALYEVDTIANTLIPFLNCKLRQPMLSNYSFVLKNGHWLLSLGEKEFMILNPVTKTFHIYNARHADYFFPDSTINVAYIDKQDDVWFGTNNGLYRFNEKTGKSVLMNASLGLNNEPVKAMLSDDKGIWWLALEKELLRWDSNTNQTLRIGNELGLKVGSFLPAIAQIDERERIYIASTNGVLMFDPSKIKISNVLPLLHISSIQLKEEFFSNEQIQIFEKGKTVLQWNENFLNIAFGTSEVYSPIPHHFYYRVIGLDSNWVDNGVSNKLRLTNLSPGAYTIQVKIINGYNITSNVLEIPFTIALPFWSTWWFYFLMILLAVALLYLFLKYRERSFIQQQALLEKRIQERTAEVVAKADEINVQKEIIEEKNKELTDSIFYAQRIQQSVLPEAAQIIKELPNHFILFNPKDIVSGDFYWYSKQADSVLWAVVDCTGHGVPGGFMSMLGSGLLNQIVNEELKLQPDEILNHLRDRVILALKQTGEFNENKDGMDMAICRYMPATRQLQYAGANNAAYIVRENELIELNPNKQPIGIHVGEKKDFTLHEITLKNEDVVFMSSDGYADQFGGPKGKKFKKINLEKLFVQISNVSSEAQLQELTTVFNNWQGNYEQLDDVCVFGVKFLF
jgi:serine phosphatase RsbU (regulator of sigma subunit)/ligand-binding sensor domain-containing protein